MSHSVGQAVGSFPNIHVILVDDEAGVVLALKLLLQTIGLTVTTFTEPEKALAFIASGAEVDLIISDLRMPKMNGFALLEEVRVVSPDLPFVLMSGHATDADFDNALKRGAVGVLAKPFSPSDVQNILLDLATREQSAA